MGTTPSRPVIVVTDLSRHGLRAFEDAHALAAATSSAVVAVTHAEVVPVRDERPITRDELDVRLGEHVAGVKRGAAPIERHVLDGDAASAVERLARGCRARTIVVAAPLGRRRIPLRRSLAEQLVRTASRPVLVTARTDAPLGAEVLSATAELTEPGDGVEWAARLVWIGHTRVLACFLGDDAEPVPPMERPLRLASPPPIRRAREALLARLRPLDVAVYPDDVHLFPLAPERAIASLADRHDADLVVLACRGGGGVRHFLLSNVAARVVARSRCAVLALPLDEDVAAEAKGAEAVPTMA